MHESKKSLAQRNLSTFSVEKLIQPMCIFGYTRNVLHEAIYLYKTEKQGECIIITHIIFDVDTFNKWTDTACKQFSYRAQNFYITLFHINILNPRSNVRINCFDDIFSCFPCFNLFESLQNKRRQEGGRGRALYE